MIDAGGATQLSRAASLRRNVAITGADGEVQRSEWGIAIEAPVEIALNGTPWTVMLATPGDLEDLAVGLVTTERLLRDVRDIENIVVSEFLHDVSVNLIVPEAAIDRTALRSRSLLSSTACGFCGLESLAQLHQCTDRDHTSPQTVAATDAAILRAFAALPALQPINQATRSVHAAAWCTPAGEIVLAREDVGRHNALDKLVGAMARRELLHDAGFVIMSSRCSYELVYKTAATNAQLLATISAPTSMALEWSTALSLPLACWIDGESGGRVVRFPAEEPDGA